MSDFNKDNVIHTHNGVGSPRLDPRYFLGFQVLDATPTHDALNGTIVYTAISGVYNQWLFADGLWQNLTGNT